MSRERLREAVNFLPLDQWQSAAVARDIDRLSEEEAKEIAIELKEAVSELPDILDEFDTAFGKAIADLNASDYGNFSIDRQPQLDAPLEPNMQLNEETDASELIVAAIFYTRSQIDKIKRQLIKEKDIPDRDIYIASVEEENSQPIIKFPQSFTPVEIDGFFILWLLSGFLIGIGLDVLYFGMSTLPTLYGGIPAIFIPFISPIIVGSIYILFKSLQTSIDLKKSLIDVYRNHLHVGEFLLIVKIPNKSDSSIHVLLEELGGVEVKVIGKKSPSRPLGVLSSSRR
jgi:hypothetical protein